MQAPLGNYSPKVCTQVTPCFYAVSLPGPHLFDLRVRDGCLPSSSLPVSGSTAILQPLVGAAQLLPLSIPRADMDGANSHRQIQAVGPLLGYGQQAQSKRSRNEQCEDLTLSTSTTD